MTVNITQEGLDCIAYAVYKNTPILDINGLNIPEIRAYYMEQLMVKQDYVEIKPGDTKLLDILVSSIMLNYF